MLKDKAALFQKENIYLKEKLTAAENMNESLREGSPSVKEMPQRRGRKRVKADSN